MRAHGYAPSFMKKKIKKKLHKGRQQKNEEEEEGGDTEGGEWMGDLVGDNERTRGKEKWWKNTHCGTAGLKDAHVWCCSRSPASAAASQGCAVHQRETAGGGREGMREGEADDVKSFKSFRSPLHDMWPPTRCIIHPVCFLIALDTGQQTSCPDVIVPAHPLDLHWPNHGLSSCPQYPHRLINLLCTYIIFKNIFKYTKTLCLCSLI